jgi:DNA-binding XRE family transcriptional regulator
VQSMGTMGDSYDNAMMEIAWSSLKRELVYETHFAERKQGELYSNGSFGITVSDFTALLTTCHQWSSKSSGSTKKLRDGCPVTRGKPSLNFRAYRTARGLSQEDCADEVGVHRTYMGGIERGERNLALKSLERLAECLRIDPLDLLATRRSRRK